MIWIQLKPYLDEVFVQAAEQVETDRTTGIAHIHKIHQATAVRPDMTVGQLLDVLGRENDNSDSDKKAPQKV